LPDLEERRKYHAAVEHGIASIGAQPVLYASAESHHSLDKSAGLLGAVGFVSIDPTDPRAQKTSHHAITEAGISQHRIARATRQSQSEVSEIIAGRRVTAYDVLERIAEGLRIPREYMGLGYGPRGA